MRYKKGEKILLKTYEERIKEKYNSFGISGYVLEDLGKVNPNMTFIIRKVVEDSRSCAGYYYLQGCPAWHIRDHMIKEKIEEDNSINERTEILDL